MFVMRSLGRAAMPLLLTALVISAASTRSRACAQDASAFAQQLFTSGVAHYDEGEYAAALEDFRGSVSLYGSPNTRLYLGRTYRELGNLTEAISELERAAREAADRAATDPRYERTRDTARTESAELVARVGRIAFVAADVPPGARVTVGGVEVPTAAIGSPIRVMPGAVEIVIEAEGYETVRRSAEVTGGETASVELTFSRVATIAAVPDASTLPRPAASPSAAPGPSSLVIVGAVSLALGGALAGTAIATGVLTADRYASLRAACGADGACPADRAGEISQGSTFAVASTALTVSASVVGVLGVVLLVASAFEGPPATQEHVRLVPGPGLLGGGIECSF